MASASWPQFHLHVYFWYEYLQEAFLCALTSFSRAFFVYSAHLQSCVCYQEEVHISEFSTTTLHSYSAKLQILYLEIINSFQYLILLGVNNTNVVIYTHLNF